MDTRLKIVGILSVLMILPETRLAEIIEQNDSMDEALPLYRVATVLKDPWMMLGENGYEGILVDLLEEISKQANFTYIILRPPGRVDDRTKYMGGEIHVNGVIGEIISGRADLGVADLVISDLRSQVVSFSSPFATTGAQILLRKPDDINRRGLHMIFVPFSTSLWICILSAILVTTAVVYLTERFAQPVQHENNHKITNMLSLLESFQFTLSLSFKRDRRDIRIATESRLLLVCWRVFAIIMITAYTASLTGYILTTSTSKPHIPFKTFEEMAGQSDIQYGGWFEMTLNVNDNIQRSMNRHIGSKYTYYSDINEAVQRVLDKNHPFSAIVEGYDGQRAVNENCELMLLQERLFDIDYGVACSRERYGEALCNNISIVIQTLREDGTLYEIMNKWWESSRKCKLVTENDFVTTSRTGISDLDFKTLDISDVFAAFLLLFIGIILSVIKTIVYRKCRQRMTTKEDREDELDRVSVSNENHNKETVNCEAVVTNDVNHTGQDHENYSDIDE